ncbi:enoyl-CoA hydratase/isomerase family protein [Sphaerotilus microaerophilus]|uniref:3-hydroxybutyryl-CoA dehydratase n=1 Tax=Sphaerotilus microaerophilus TaxID=2914710 RepID=A0ABM7YPM5_9BURK|nr:enoyl-CoA hydratase/isomerase family protein [Sphaerotilus sp. FB-5]BDI06465.1 3-hydroxybutyryl-CoA dehydratase [Sphaerotilus sp. FB-5]
MAGADSAVSLDIAAGLPSLAIDGHIATITLRRPKVANRLELEDLAALGEHLATVNARDEVLVLRLQAEGRHFCSGFNIARVDGGGEAAGARFEALAEALENARPVTVAAIQGGIYGGATDLALACDFRLGTPASEWRVPAARLGLHYYLGGLERYVARLGLQAAKRVMLTAETFDAPAMLATGMLDRVVPAAELAYEVEAFCTQLAGLAPLALLAMKKNLNRLARGTLDVAEAAADIARAAASEDLKEGARAWAEKRPPVFQGR